jgi:hypothetical protein
MNLYKTRGKIMKGMAKKKIGLMVFFVLLGFILSGCGLDALEEEKAPVLNASDGAVVTYYSGEVTSSTVCYVCHPDDAQPAGLSPVFGDSAADGWLDGPHANNESIDQYHNHLDLSPDNVGFPDYGYFSDSTCATCHDKRGDGMTLAAFYAETGIDALGRVNRPIIGCEGCHGSSKDHSDIGAALVQHAAPGAEGCQPCHNDTFPDGHLKYHPEGDRIYEDYIASPHTRSINSHTYVRGSTTEVRGKCSKCHTDEGAKLYKDVSGGHDALGTLLDSAPALTNPNVVQCRTCHDAHNPDTLLKPATASNSAEYETCTNCHQTADSYHGENSGHSWTGSTPPTFPVGIGNFESDGIIYDTHFDDPNTPQRNPGPFQKPTYEDEGIEGYVMDTSNEHVCRDCHNVHSADNTINEQWAKSAHAGHILEEKEEAFSSISGSADPYGEALRILNGTAGYGIVNDETGAAWNHYPWKHGAMGSCQQCHTATGYKNLMTDPTSYIAANNVFTATGNQAELLYCWACHKDSAGGLRDTYTFKDTVTKQYSMPAGRIANVPDLSGSNLCVVCHSGRKSGEQIASFVYNASSIYDNTAFTSVYPHYLLAGGTLFKTIGYEFDGMSYGGWFAHDSIGADSNGPCVGCHMNHDEGHTFEAVEKSATGQITDITAFDQTCWNFGCHGPGIKSDIEDLREGYEAAAVALLEELKAAGFTYTGSRPYFAGDDWTVTYAAQDSTGKNNLGSAFNLYVVLHEPGAYAHNSRYARRLIFDSIDWLQDGSLDGELYQIAPVNLLSNSSAIGWLGRFRP